VYARVISNRRCRAQSPGMEVALFDLSKILLDPRAWLQKSEKEGPKGVFGEIFVAESMSAR